jgi:glucokinase
MRCLAIDIGGTKIAAGIVDSSGEILKESQVKTPKTEDENEVFNQVINAISDLGGEFEIIGVGCGGPMSRSKELVSPVNIKAWRDFNLKTRIKEIFNKPVFIDNDAKALALAEGWLGAAQNSDNFIAMVVSTGVGGGIVLNGRLLDGRESNAGHIGHLIVEPEGHLCGCGARGCLEAEASGTAIFRMTGRDPRGADIEIKKRSGRLVGRALSSVANLLDLNLAVIAGSVALGFGEPFFEAANEEIRNRCKLEFSKDMLAIPAGLGKNGPLIGAAAVGFRGINE